MAAPNNNRGEIIKIFMITSSGAEGISLKNVRYVHIMEPYWNFIRIDQVFGRAIRMKSHMDLPSIYETPGGFNNSSVISITNDFF